MYFQQRSIGEHKRQSFDPLPRAAVLECCSAGRIGGNRAAHEGAVERRDWRVIEPVCAASTRCSSVKRHAGPRAHQVAGDHRDAGQSARVLRITSPRGVAPPVSDDCAPIGRTRCADVTSAATSPASSWQCDACRKPAGHMGGVAQERFNQVGTGFNGRHNVRMAPAARQRGAAWEQPPCDSGL